MPCDNGEAPWRPTYGNLDSFRLLLPTTASVSALTATANSYVDSMITKKLNLRTNTVKVSSSLNRPNITYATLDVDNFSNFNNLMTTLPQNRVCVAYSVLRRVPPPYAFIVLFIRLSTYRVSTFLM